MTADDDAALVAAMKATNTLDKRATLIYRCNSRACPLLYVFTADGRRFAHQPRYKLSDDVNKRETVAAARAKHTIDGDRRWKAETFPLAQAGGHLSLECDHCRVKVHVDSIEADITAATRLPTTIRLGHGDMR